MRTATLIIGAALLLLAPAHAGEMDQYALVQIVADRQEIMGDIERAYWPLLDVKRGKSMDLAAAAEAARSIRTSLDEFTPLLIPGTVAGDVPNSRAKPEVWTEPAEFAVALDALQAAAAALSVSASSGDIELFKAQFDTFASACLGCHELKPSGGGRFREAWR